VRSRGCEVGDGSVVSYRLGSLRSPFSFMLTLSRCFHSFARSPLSSATPLWVAALLAATGCGPKAPPPKPPAAPVATTEPTAAPAAAPAPEAPPPKVPADAFSIGTFNLDWAYDSIDAKRPKHAQPHVATDDAAWEWKRDRIVEVLVAEKLDIVALAEAGGDREISDITSSVKDKGGPDYQYAWVKGEDAASGRQVAILSRFPISNERRTDAYAPIHVAAEVELPGGEAISVIAVHLKEGGHKGAVGQRMKMASSLKLHSNRERKKRPVIIVGTVGDPTLPFDDAYSASAAGLLAGKPTGKKSDDCHDSASETLAQGTTVGKGEAMDRIFVCGLELRGAETSGSELIVREEEDPEDTPWPSVPLAAAPHRDVSDHLVLWAEVALPKKPQPAEAGDPPPAAAGAAE
jgi:endonuclease/exonuclease/phosphatase family metal-dependent hydrolase